MAFIRNLGAILSFQKFYIIPNFNGTIVTTFFKSIPVLIFLSLAVNDIIYVLTTKKMSPLYDISSLADIVSRLELLISRLAFILIFLIGIKYNTQHLYLISCLVEFENSLEQTFQVRRKKSKILRSNVDISVTIAFNFILYLNFFYVTSSVINIEAIIAFINQIIILIANDVIVLYVIHIMKELQEFSGILCRCGKLNNYASFKVIMKIFELPYSINSALAGMLFVSFIQHMGSSALVSYFVFWIGFGTGWFPEKIFFLIACGIWFLRNIFSIIYLTIVGHRLTHRFQDVMKLLANQEERFHLVEFNKKQVQLWLSHLEHKTILAGSIEITNEGFFSILSFTTTCLIILLQFKQLEDSDGS
uniref:Uncharacterized protein n=1 Tax=Lutzomyia longipalpis TaxID=7200 RepID=A0A3F2ZD93_LUTLO